MIHKLWILFLICSVMFFVVLFIGKVIVPFMFFILNADTDPVLKAGVFVATAVGLVLGPVIFMSKDK